MPKEWGRLGPREEEIQGLKTTRTKCSELGKKGARGNAHFCVCYLGSSQATRLHRMHFIYKFIFSSSNPGGGKRQPRGREVYLLPFSS
jgi:hypothetical protein